MITFLDTYILELEKLQQKKYRNIGNLYLTCCYLLLPPAAVPDLSAGTNLQLDLMFMKHYAPNRCLYIKVAKLRTGVGSAETSYQQNCSVKLFKEQVLQSPNLQREIIRKK